jgi:predicted transcriptional regulator
MFVICWYYIDTLVSGSPVVQNGKFVGVVTHMLETAQGVAEEQKLKEAS